MPRKARPASSTIRLYVARSGPKRGDPECQAAFQSKEEAVRFLMDLHGLEVEEGRKLKRESRLPLKKKVHGAEVCQIAEEEMLPAVAKQALSGELYLEEASRLLTPRRLR